MLIAKKAGSLGVKVGSEWLLIDPSVNPAFFECFASSGMGWRRIILDAALGKRPSAGPGPDQQELDFVVSNAITHSSNVSSSQSFPGAFNDLRDGCQQRLP